MKKIYILAIISILFTNIVWSSSNSVLEVNGTAVVLPKIEQDIGITNVRVVERTNESYETYSNTFTNNTVDLFATLPANSSLTYEVIISNRQEDDYVFSDIITTLHQNDSVSYAASIDIGTIIPKQDFITFNIMLTNNTNTEQLEILKLRFSYVDGYAKFITGEELNKKMKRLSGSSSASATTTNTNITEILRANTLPNEYQTSNNIVSSSDSPVPIYMWFTSGKIYWYTEAGITYLNPDCYRLFYRLSVLTNIDLSTIYTNNVTNMNNMFAECSKLISLDMINWNTSNVTNMYRMFYNDSALTELDLSSFDTSNVTTIYGMFHGCTNLKTIYTFGDLDLSKVTEYSFVLYNCTSLTGEMGTKTTSSNLTNLKIDRYPSSPGVFTNKDTSEESIYFMVYNEGSNNYSMHINASGNVIQNKTLIGKYRYTKSNMSNVNTAFTSSSATQPPWYKSTLNSNVNYIKRIYIDEEVNVYGSMNYWFYKLINMTQIDNLSNLKTNNVTSMAYLFSDCNSLVSLDLSGWSTSNVVDMNHIFHSSGYDYNLKTLNVSTWNTSNVTDMSFMFGYRSGLTSLDVSSFNTSKVTTMYRMFYYNSALTELDLSGFDISNVTNIDNMFYNCTNLETIYTLGDWDTSNITSSSSFLSNCTSLIGEMGTKSLNDLTLLRIDRYPSAPGIFTNKDTSEESIYFMIYDEGSNNYSMHINASGNVIQNRTLLGKYRYTKSNMSNVNTAFTSSSATQPPWYKYYVKTINNVSTNRINRIYIDEQVHAYGSMNYWFYNLVNVTQIDNLSNLKTNNVTSMAYLFSDCNSLVSLDLSGWSTSNVVDMNHIFHSSNSNYSLITLNVSTWNTSNVTDMSYMFGYRSGLTSLDVSSFNTSKVTTMYRMFYYNSALTELDLSSFDISNVTDIENMFYNCTNLETIYTLGDWDTSNITKSSNFLANCISLRGEIGTPYKSDLTYLRIDKYPTALGVFTNKDKSEESIYFMIYDEGSNNYSMHINASGNVIQNRTLLGKYRYTKSNMSNINSVFTTSSSTQPPWYKNHMLTITTGNGSVTNNRINRIYIDEEVHAYGSMNYWFYNLVNVTQIDNLSNLKTNNVTSMAYLFYNDSLLQNIDLSSFNTSNVTNMSYMFYYCNRLRILDLSNFDISNVTNIKHMFDNNTSLRTIYVSAENSNWNIDQITSSTDAFLQCTDINGGNGTTYNSSYGDKRYAKVDEVGSPGYFTLKAT